MKRLLATHNSSLARWWRRRRSRYVSARSPVVLADCQRSGATLLRVILDSHPHIACGPESSLLTGGFLPEKLAARFEIPVAEVWHIHDTARDHAQFADHFLCRYAEQRGKVRWAEKTPQNVRHIDWILQHFPQAKIIHVLRDGRDAVCSIRTHPKYRIVNGQQTLTGIHRPLRPCIEGWLRDTAAGLQWRGHANYLEVRYEDIITDAETQLRKLCEFIAEPWNPSLLEYYKYDGTSRDPIHFIVNVAATKPLNNTAVQRWRRDLSTAELQLFHRLADHRQAELGYDTAPATAAAQPISITE